MHSEIQVLSGSMSFDSSIHLSNHHTKQIQKTHTLYHTEAAPRFPAPAISPFGLFLCFKEMGLFGLHTDLWLLCLRMVRWAKSWSFLLCHRALLEGGVAVDPFSFAGVFSSLFGAGKNKAARMF